MKRILLPAGGAILATGLLAAGLAGTANAVPDWAYDTMAKDAPAAVDVAEFWLAANGHTNNLAKATPYTWETKATPKLNAGGGYVADGKPGAVKPIGEEGKPAAKVKNINLPKTIGKVFFVDEKGELKWCSATSIQGKYRNLVATAGHCVYDDKADASVMDNWVFVPGYYQGKTPWGIYVGKTAYTHYDFANYEDYDRDYAFVTVYNGVQVGGGTAKEVSESEYKAFNGAKAAKDVSISEAEYKKTVDLHGGETSAAWAKAETISDPVGPNFPGAVLTLQEVSKEAYDKAPVGKGVNGAKAHWATTTEHVTKAQYDAYTGVGYRKIDAKGNYTITHYYVKYWVKKSNVKSYYKTVFFIVEGFIKDTGKLGDNVGGQGFTWNQKPQQTVFVFGYPADAHP
ncbi:trypsin-like serine peptidase, partial [Streptosporangium longisporum]